MLASGSVDTEVHLFDLTPPPPEKGEREATPTLGKELARLVGHRGTVQCLIFSPDGRKLVSGSADATSLVWEVPLAADKPGDKPAQGH
jgi:WD40 repeat protein